MIVNRNSFAPVSPTEAYVLGSDGNLWLERFGSGQTTRGHVDGDVQAFQPLGSAQALVLGLDGNLWLEQGPWGTVPPKRQQVDRNVNAFQALGLGTITQIYVLQDGNLWLEQGRFGQQVPSARRHVDGQVADFFGVSGTEVYVLGSDGNLWLEQGQFGTVPPKRQQIDSDVRDFFVLTNLSGQVFVLGQDGNLWLEQAPAAQVRPPRQQIDDDVLAFLRAEAGQP